jgi:hypothetical protein
MMMTIAIQIEQRLAGFCFITCPLRGVSRKYITPLFWRKDLFFAELRIQN